MADLNAAIHDRHPRGEELLGKLADYLPKSGLVPVTGAIERVRSAI